MTTALRDVLIIYRDGEEVPGITVYGLRPKDDYVAPQLDSLLGSMGARGRQTALYGDRWQVFVWDLAVAQWPSNGEFEELIERALRWLISEGFAVAWVGLEGHFVDPPQLFDPEYMSGGVVAAFTAETGFLSGLDLDGPLKALPEAEVVRLRDASDGLALAE